eukprot:scaffold131287_cov15-Tisochrysis_lutea.AAC.1
MHLPLHALLSKHARVPLFAHELTFLLDCLVAQNALLEPPSFCCVSAENVVLSCWWGCWCCCRNAGVAEKAPGLKGCARGLAKSGHACSGGSWT